MRLRHTANGRSGGRGSTSLQRASFKPFGRIPRFPSRSLSLPSIERPWSGKCPFAGRPHPPSPPATRMSEARLPFHAVAEASTRRATAAAVGNKKAAGEELCGHLAVQWRGSYDSHRGHRHWMTGEERRAWNLILAWPTHADMRVFVLRRSARRERVFHSESVESPAARLRGHRRAAPPPEADSSLSADRPQPPPSPLPLLVRLNVHRVTHERCRTACFRQRSGDENGWPSCWFAQAKK